VKGKDLSSNLSAASNTVEVSTFFGGLYYEHTTGLWTDIDSVDWSWAEFTGRVYSFTLSPKTQDDYFNFSFDGFLLITKGGSYEFRTGSDDGSRLFLDGTLQVENDHIDNFKLANSAAVSLQPGPHRILVRFFEYIESDSLTVEYKGPDTGNQWATISNEVLKSDPNVITGVGSEADNGPEDSFKLSVFPNPTTQDNIHVLVETVIPAPVRVTMLDPMGRSVFDETFQPDQIFGGINITPPGVMNTGMYVVMAAQGKTVVRQKVVVKRQ